MIFLFLFHVGFELDGVASVEYLLSRPDIDHGKLVLYGRSLGGAVAFNVAALDQYTDFLFAVIVENTFTSIPEISKYLFKYLRGLPEWCYKNKVILVLNTLQSINILSINDFYPDNLQHHFILSFILSFIQSFKKDHPSSIKILFEIFEKNLRQLNN